MNTLREGRPSPFETFIASLALLGTKPIIRLIVKVGLQYDRKNLERVTMIGYLVTSAISASFGFSLASVLQAGKVSELYLELALARGEIGELRLRIDAIAQGRSMPELGR